MHIIIFYRFDSFLEVCLAAEASGLFLQHAVLLNTGGADWNKPSIVTP